MKTRYRIVTDNYAGYECQVKRWYSIFWRQLDGVNTHITIDHAKAQIEADKVKHSFKRKEVWRS